MHKRSLLFLICILFFTKSFAQCTTDSVVVHTFYYYAWTVDTLYSSVDWAFYNTDSGTVTHSLSYSTHSTPWTQPSITNGYFSRTDTTYNAGGYPIWIITNSGTSNGWVPDSALNIEYNSDNFRTAVYHLTWNGTSWDSLYYQSWTYDTSNHILSSAIFNRNGNIWDNVTKTDITYVNDHPDVKIIQNGSGNTWSNYKKYSFVYNNTLRTSADLYDADSLGNWILTGHYTYQMNDSSQWVIRLVDTNQTSPFDTTLIEFDTLENLVHYASWVVTATNWWPDYEEYYRYIDSTLLMLYSSYAEIQGGHTVDRPDVDYYTFDSLHRLIEHNLYGRCTNPCGTEIATAYDEYGRPTLNHNYEWTMVSDWYIYDDWVYLDSSSLKLIVPQAENNILICKDSVYKPQLFAFGGCQPYHFLWTPSTGLSSDTIMQPGITVTDSITYTIYVYDDYGHSDTATYRINMANFYTNAWSDSIACDGNRKLSIHYYDQATFAWYLDSSSNVVGNMRTYITDTTGNYWCRIEIDYVSTHQFHCAVNSDTIAILQPPTVIITQSNDTLYASYPVSSYIWYLDTALEATTSVPFYKITYTGDYYVMITDAQGCPRTSSTIHVISLGMENETESRFLISMNDEMNRVYISNESGIKSYNLLITDVTGKAVLSKKFHEIKNEIDVSGLSTGVYILNIETKNNVITRKIFVN